jgi:hypothetical protein
MRILSIDVGIKNLAYCLMETKTQDIQGLSCDGPFAQDFMIHQWDAVSLCAPVATCAICAKKAKYTSADGVDSWCGTHAKGSPYKIPPTSIKLNKLKTMKVDKLQQLVTDQGITLDPVKEGTSSAEKKAAIVATLLAAFLTPATTVSANDMDLVSLGVALVQRFDIDFPAPATAFDQVIIENQISPIANRMKTLQGMLAQYFIMRGQPNIKFVSSSNKLKEFTPVEAPTAPEAPETVPAEALSTPKAPTAPKAPAAKSTYSDRKKASVTITQTLLLADEDNSPLLSFFISHAKKDDLADCFLQGLWYLRRKSK